MTRSNKHIKRILNVLIGLGAFFLIITVGFAITEMRYYIRDSFHSDHLMYYIDEQRYDRVVGEYYESNAFVDNHKNSEDLKNLAEYVEAVIYERAFRENDMTEKADKYLKIMEEKENQLGIYSVEREAILELYGE